MGEVKPGVFIVSHIVKHWVAPEGITVRIRWVGYGSQEDTNQPLEDIGHDSSFVQQYAVKVWRLQKSEIYLKGEHVSLMLNWI
jgi:hypothetical protein